MIDYPIYIMHYTKNVLRKSLLEKVLEKEKCSNPVRWITEHDKESVPYMTYNRLFKADHLEWQNRGYREFSPHYPLKPEEVSLCLKHMFAMDLFTLDSSHEFALFLEDDAILDNGFFEKLDSYLPELPGDFDVAFIGRGCKEGLPVGDDVVWYENQTDRNTDSMIMSLKFCNRFLRHCNQNKICYPIDHELNFFFKVNNCKVYWLNKPLVTQGSHLGVFASFQEAHSRYLNEELPYRNDLLELIRE